MQDNLETCEENELMAMDREITEKSERLNDLSAQLKSMLSGTPYFFSGI